MSNLQKISLVVLLLLAACTPFQSRDPLPVTHTIEIILTPTLQPLSHALQACASEQEDIILFFRERPALLLLDTPADLYFRLGEPQQPPEFIAPIAWEDIVVIAHPSAEIGTLNQTRLRAIFSGAISAEDENNFQVWVPLIGNEARSAFEETILSGSKVSSLAKLAPSPFIMLTQIAGDPDAIGLIPKAVASDEVQIIDLGIRLPLLVMANERPSGPAITLVSCLQSQAGQVAIGLQYTPWNE